MVSSGQLRNGGTGVFIPGGARAPLPVAGSSGSSSSSSGAASAGGSGSPPSPSSPAGTDHAGLQQPQPRNSPTAGGREASPDACAPPLGRSLPASSPLQLAPQHQHQHQQRGNMVGTFGAVGQPQAHVLSGGGNLISPSSSLGALSFEAPYQRAFPQSSRHSFDMRPANPPASCRVGEGHMHHGAGGGSAATRANAAAAAAAAAVDAAAQALAAAQAAAAAAGANGTSAAAQADSLSMQLALLQLQQQADVQQQLQAGVQQQLEALQHEALLQQLLSSGACGGGDAGGLLGGGHASRSSAQPGLSGMGPAAVSAPLMPGCDSIWSTGSTFLPFGTMDAPAPAAAMSGAHLSGANLGQYSALGAGIPSNSGNLLSDAATAHHASMLSGPGAVHLSGAALSGPTLLSAAGVSVLSPIDEQMGVGTFNLRAPSSYMSGGQW